MNKKQKVIVTLSGGVDSAVCACLLKNNNQYELQAVYMRNWDAALNNDLLGHKNKQKGCTDLEDLAAVQSICQQLNLPLKIYNFVDEYWNLVFNPSLELLKKGYTPNPDVLCNQKIKFGALLEVIKQDFGDDVLVATGHYAKVIEQDNQFLLGTAQNKHKDQTYFLNQLNQAQLKKIIFPLHFINDKNEVRAIAKQNNLSIWNKPDSTGICFIGERNYKQFMHNYLQYQSGPIINITNQEVIGEHDGLFFCTLGQRKGLNISGQVEPMYVCAKNHQQNILYVCPESAKNQYLQRSQTRVLNPNWISQQPQLNTPVYLRFRHTGQLILAEIMSANNQEITFKHAPIITTAPGQYVVVYSLDQKICYGGGVYDESIQGQ